MAPDEAMTAHSYRMMGTPMPSERHAAKQIRQNPLPLLVPYRTEHRIGTDDSPWLSRTRHRIGTVDSQSKSWRHGLGGAYGDRVDGAEVESSAGRYVLGG